MDKKELLRRKRGYALYKSKAKDREAIEKPIISEKMCSSCETIFPAERFNKRNASKDGLSPVCKDCQNIIYKKWKENKAKGPNLDLEITIHGDSSDCSPRTGDSGHFKCVNYHVFKKECLKCKETKHSSLFNADKYKDDGRTVYCKSCLSIGKKIVDKRKKSGALLKRHTKQNVKDDQKFCSNCNIFKPFSGFYIQKTSRTGFSGYCKSCQDTKNRSLLKNECYAKKAKETRGKRIERLKSDITWRRKRNAQSEMVRKRKMLTPHGRIELSLLSGIRTSLKRKKRKNPTKWDSVLGYTIDDLKRHIESKFVGEMTWQSVLNGEIQIDHVIPRASFCYESIEDQDFKDCWALENLQPLWATDNMSKSDKMPDGTDGRLIGERKRALLAEESSIAGWEKTSNKSLEEELCA